MTESFTIGDSMKYSCIHEGAKLIIGDWELFDKDWGDFKEKAKKLGVVQSSIDTVRNALYDALPKGEVDAFELIKVINNHISKLDMILETLK